MQFGGRDNNNYVDMEGEHASAENGNGVLNDNSLESKTFLPSEDGEGVCFSSFREELDNITKSMENGTNLDALLLEAKRVSVAVNHVIQASSPHRPSHSRVDTLSNTNSNASKAPNNTGRQSSDDPRQMIPDTLPATAATPEPPTPVKTPLRSAPCVRTPTRVSPTRTPLRGGGGGNTDTPSRSVPTSHPRGGRRSCSHRTSTEDDNPINHPPFPRDPTTVREWKQLVHSLRDTVETQQQQIRELEVENQRLLQQSPHYTNGASRVGLSSSSHGSRNSSRGAAFDSDACFSPGTKFAAELTQVLDIPSDQVGELSRIMDKHIGRLRERRADPPWGA